MNSNSHSLLVRMQNGIITFQRVLRLLTKLTNSHRLIQKLCSSVLPKGVENLCPHKTLHTDVYSSVIPNRQNLEATKCPSVGERINEQWSVRTMGYYSTLEEMSYQPRQDRKKLKHTCRHKFIHTHRMSNTKSEP